MERCKDLNSRTIAERSLGPERADNGKDFQAIDADPSRGLHNSRIKTFYCNLCNIVLSSEKSKEIHELGKR